MPDDPLLNWCEWNLPITRKPSLIRELTVGRTNQSYLIEADKQLWVLRINAINSKVLGIDRQREKVILENASLESLAPKILYCSVEHGVLITEFIDGEHWQAADLKDTDKLFLLMETLHRIHTLNVSTKLFDYRQHAENYWQQLLHRNITVSDKLHHQRDELLQMLVHVPGSNIICHHDPTPQNIIFSSDKLYFLDWEYAAPGWPAFDFAALSTEWNIPINKLALQTGIDTEEINEALSLYYFLCNLWSCLQRNEAMNS